MSSQIDPSKVPSANLPVIPDKVVKRIQDGKDVPLEAISEAATEIREKSGLERAKPLHAETLTPITQYRANQIISGSPDGKLQHGVMPRAPQTRRVIPPPFRRESISIRVPGEPQAQWHNVRADQVLVGDIVPDVGKVVEVLTQPRYSSAEEQVPVTVHGGAPGMLIEKTFDAGEYDLLRKQYGSTQVAVGVDVVLTGPENCQLVVDHAEQVRVFGIR